MAKVKKSKSVEPEKEQEQDTTASTLALMDTKIKKRKPKKATNEYVTESPIITELQTKLQAKIDNKKIRYLDEFIVSWNKSNKEKIYECMKIGESITFRITGIGSVRVFSDWIRLG